LVIACDVADCNQLFTGKGRKLQLKRHVERKHLNVKSKQCPHCDLKFYETRDLNRHVDAIHLRMRTICPVQGCGKPVVRLDQHMKIVHSDKPKDVENTTNHVCKQCGTRFGRIYDLSRHQDSVHKGQKNFSCDKCDKRFFDKRDLKRHHDAVHLHIKQSKVYSCSICSAKFRLKKMLDAHRLSSHGDQNRPPEKSLVQSSKTVEDLSISDSDRMVISVEDLSHEVNTVEMDGQLFLVQQGPDGISLYGLSQSSLDQNIIS